MLPSAPRNVVGARDYFSVAARWLACVLPCRRFAYALTDVGARLGADVGRYSFIATDLHRLLLAGLPGALRAESAAKESEQNQCIACGLLELVQNWGVRRQLRLVGRHR
jgi:hypothetical protein